MEPREVRNGNQDEKVDIEEVIPLKVQNGTPVRDKILEDDTLITDKTEDACIRPVLFEEAIARTGHGRFHYFLLFACGMSLVSMIVELLCVSYLMPAADCDFQMTSEDKGLLSAVCYIGMIASSHLWGYLADTQGRKKILIITLLSDFVCALVGSFAHTFWLFLIFRFFNGFFICGPSAVVYVYLGEFHTTENRARAIIVACVFISIGIISLPGLAWLVIPMEWSVSLPWVAYRPWRLFVVLCGIPSISTACILFFLPESPKYYFAVGKEEEAIKVLQHVFAVNRQREPEEYTVHAILQDSALEGTSFSPSPTSQVDYKQGILQHIWTQTAPLFMSPHVFNTLLACLIQFGIYASFNSLLLWLPDLFNRIEVYAANHANQSATVCEIFSSVRNFSSLSSDAIEAHTFGDLSEVTNVTAGLSANTTKQMSAVRELANKTLAGVTEELNITSTCAGRISPLVFQNTLIIGLTSALAYLLVGQIVNHIENKKIIAFSLGVSGLAIVGLHFAHTSGEVLPLSCIFVALPGMCVSILNSLVVDVFPTHLRYGLPSVGRLPTVDTCCQCRPGDSGRNKNVVLCHLHHPQLLPGCGQVSKVKCLIFLLLFVPFFSSLLQFFNYCSSYLFLGHSSWSFSCVFINNHFPGQSLFSPLSGHGHTISNLLFQ